MANMVAAKSYLSERAQAPSFVSAPRIGQRRVSPSLVERHAQRDERPCLL